MADRNITGGALASPPIAEAERFLAIGGRLMIDPRGRFSSVIDAGKLFERTDRRQDASAFQQRRAVAARYLRSERRYRSALASLVHQHGTTMPHGWRVWEGR